MSAARVSTADRPMAAQAEQARERMRASGTMVTEWARMHGFSTSAVHEVLRGNRLCIRGNSHRIAVALGMKPAAAPPGPTEPDRLDVGSLEPAR